MSVSVNIDDILAEQTEGRPFVFVIMAYKKQWELFRQIERVVDTEFKLPCLRADHCKSSGEDLRNKIHALIDRAEAVVAEISTRSENVFYEVGYAVATGRTPLLLVEKAQARKVPTDLLGLEKIEYTLDQHGSEALEKELASDLGPKLRSGIELMRRMLLGKRADSNYILASPRYPDPGSCIWGRDYDTRTFGDYQAILRLISAFSPMLGTGRNVELISARHIPPDTLKRPWNLYLVGSGNVNPLADDLLKMLQDGAEHVWSFAPMPGYTYGDENWPSGLFAWTRQGAKYWGAKRWADDGACASEADMKEKPRVWKDDYGLIVRGPHPRHADEGRIVMLLAGSHALGTGATGVAATDPQRIKEVRGILPPGTLEDPQSRFWVLVKGVASDDCRLDPRNVSIVDAGLIGQPLPDPPSR